jgi:class 3 adenylate cyclase/tetratricopeptide (TPR) repeat protein
VAIGRVSAREIAGVYLAGLDPLRSFTVGFVAMFTCPRCGQENPDGARFCNACAAPLAAAEEARLEERKVVTVLFADLVGFTSRAERMDPEEVRSLLRPYHARLRDELERFGGTVEKFIGDAVMAVFGAPVAHEDDAERAVRAALAIRDWILDEQAELQLRIGVNTGQALVSLGARPEEGEGMVAGDVVNTAARLQSHAPVDGILVGEATWRATRDAIDYRPAEPVQAKGKSEPVEAWEVLEARGRVGVDISKRVRAPLVGRRRELDSLLDALERARGSRSVQLVTLVGEPGIGKSRLVYELFEAVERDPELVFWRQGRSLPYGEGVSFWALGEMVKAHTGILETDDEAEADRKLRATVTATVPVDDVEWTIAHLRPLAGVEDGSGRSDAQDEVFAAWRGFLEGVADRGPLVLVFEDLHWADDGLLDFVDHLVDWATRVPLLVVATARPELLSRRSGWGGGKTNALTLSLAPLSGDETAELVHALLERAAIPAEVQATLLERAGGNPLYAEEFVRLLEERSDDATLPETVQGIIAARLDLLDRDEKELLQDAAVLGRVFWVGGLTRERTEAEAALHRLERRELVQRERRSSIANDTEYAFRHALVREVAYEQIPRAQRGDKHRRVADWLEALGRSEDLAELLAHHYLAVLDYAEPDAAFSARAGRALGEAGDRALKLNAYLTAAGFYRRAIELAPDEERGQLLFGLGSALFALADHAAAETLVEASDLLVQAGNPETAAEVECLLAQMAFYMADAADVNRHVDRAVELVRGRPPSVAHARSLSQAARFQMLGGEWGAAVESGREAERMATGLGLDAIRADALATVGVARDGLGDSLGHADLETAIELAEAARAPLPLSRALNNLGWCYMGIDLRRAHELFEQQYEVGQRYGHVRQIWWARAQLVDVVFQRGRWDEALEHAEAVIAHVEAGNPLYAEAASRLVRAAVTIARGDGAAFDADLHRSLALAAEATDPQAREQNSIYVAYLRLWAGDRAGARELLDSTLETARTTEVGIHLIHYQAALLAALLELDPAEIGLPPIDVVETPRQRATAALLGGDLLAAAEALAELGSVNDEAYLRLRAGERLVAEGRTEDGQAQVERALAFYRGVRAARFVAEAEALVTDTRRQSA